MKRRRIEAAMRMMVIVRKRARRNFIVGGVRVEIENEGLRASEGARARRVRISR
jgi:hypothetical protein